MKEEIIIFREYKKEDQEELENIIRKTWNYDKFCSPKIARKMARTYLANCLSNQTFTNVAVINDIPVGIIMGKDIVHYKCPLKLRINQIISNISIYLSKEGRKVIKMFSNIDKIDKDLLKNTNKNYGGEVALFVINSKYRGLGIGKKLFESLKSYMKNQNINEFFLDKQRESLRASESQQQKKMHQAVYGNLKLMKKVLTPDQYRKYVTLLNVTNNNNRALNL